MLPTLTRALWSSWRQAPPDWAGGDADLLAHLCAQELLALGEGDGDDGTALVAGVARARLLAGRAGGAAGRSEAAALREWAGEMVRAVAGSAAAEAEAKDEDAKAAERPEELALQPPREALAAAAREAPEALHALKRALAPQAPVAAALIDEAQAAAAAKDASPQRLALLGAALPERAWLAALRAAVGAAAGEVGVRAVLRAVLEGGTEIGLQYLEQVLEERAAAGSGNVDADVDLQQRDAAALRAERNVFEALASGASLAEVQVRDAVASVAAGEAACADIPRALVLLAAVAAWDEFRGDVGAQTRAIAAASKAMDAPLAMGEPRAPHALASACRLLRHRLDAARFLVEHAGDGIDTAGALEALEHSSLLGAACRLAPAAPRAELLKLVAATPHSALFPRGRPEADAGLLSCADAVIAAAELARDMLAQTLSASQAALLVRRIDKRLKALRVPALRTWMLKLVTVVTLMGNGADEAVEPRAQPQQVSDESGADALNVLGLLTSAVARQLRELSSSSHGVLGGSGGDEDDELGGIMEADDGDEYGLETEEGPDSPVGGSGSQEARFASEWEAATAARRGELLDRAEDTAWRLHVLRELPATVADDSYRVGRSDGAAEQWCWGRAVAALRASPAELVRMCTRAGRYDLANEAARRGNLPEADRSALQLKRWVDDVCASAASAAESWGTAGGADDTPPVDIAGAGVPVAPEHAASLCLDLAAAISTDGELCVRLLQQAHGILEEVSAGSRSGKGGGLKDGDWLPRALVYLFAAANADGGGKPLREAVVGVDAVASGEWPAAGDIGSNPRAQALAAFGKATERLREAASAAAEGKRQFLSGILHNLARALGECRGVDAVGALQGALRSMDSAMPAQGAGYLSLSAASERSSSGGELVRSFGVSEADASGPMSGPSPDSMTQQPSLSTSAMLRDMPEQSLSEVGSYLLEFAQYVAEVGDIVAGDDASDAFDHFAILGLPPRDIIAKLIFEHKRANAASDAAAAARRMRADIVEEVLSTCVAPVLPPCDPSVEGAAPAAAAASDESELRHGLKVEVLRHLAESSPVRAVLACVFGMLQARQKKLPALEGAAEPDGSAASTSVDMADPNEHELMAFALETAEPYGVLHRWVAQQQRAAAAIGAQAAADDASAEGADEAVPWREWESVRSHASAVRSLAAGGRCRQAIALAEKWLPCGPLDDLLAQFVQSRDADEAPCSREAAAATARIGSAREAAALALVECRRWQADDAINALECIASRLGEEDAAEAERLRARARTVRLAARLAAALSLAHWQRAEDAIASDAAGVLSALADKGEYAVAAEVESVPAAAGAPAAARAAVRAAHAADLVARRGLGAGTLAALKYLSTLGAGTADAAFEAMRRVPLAAKHSLVAFLSRREGTLTAAQRQRLERVALGVDVLAALPAPWDERCGSLHEHPPLVLETLLMHHQLAVAARLLDSFPPLLADVAVIETYARKALAAGSAIARPPSLPGSPAHPQRPRAGAHTTGAGSVEGSTSTSTSPAAPFIGTAVTCLTGVAEIDAARRAAHSYPAAPSAVLFCALVELAGADRCRQMALPIVRDIASRMRSPAPSDAGGRAIAGCLVGELAAAVRHFATGAVEGGGCAKGQAAVHADLDVCSAAFVAEADKLELVRAVLLDGFVACPAALASPQSAGQLVLALARDERHALALRVADLCGLSRAPALSAKADTLAAAGAYRESAAALRLAVESILPDAAAAAASRLARFAETLPSPAEAACSDAEGIKTLRVARIDFARELLAEHAPAGLPALLLRQGRAAEACELVLTALAEAPRPPEAQHTPLCELCELCVAFEQVPALGAALASKALPPAVARWATVECCRIMAEAHHVGYMFNLLRALGSVAPAGVAALMLAGAQAAPQRALDLCKVAQSLFELALEPGRLVSAFGALAPGAGVPPGPMAAVGRSGWAGEGSSARLASAAARCASAVAEVVGPASREAAGLPAMTPAEVRPAHVMRLAAVASLQASVLAELRASAPGRPASDWGLLARDATDGAPGDSFEGVRARRCAAAEELLVAGGPDAASVALRVTTEFRLPAAVLYAKAAARLAAGGRKAELTELLRDSRASLASSADRDAMLRAAAAAAGARQGWGAGGQAEKLAAMVHDPHTRVLALVEARRLRAALAAAKDAGDHVGVAAIKAAAKATDRGVVEACERWETKQRTGGFPEAS